MKKTLGSEIQRLRLGAGFTLRAFARQLDISAAHQSDIEHGRRMPSEDLLRTMASALAHTGTTYDDLKKLDSRLEKDLETWIQKTPEARQMLREAKDSKRPVRDILRDLRRVLEGEDEQ
jgi:transcriptional regulator with XRE-family HTH domain